MADTNDRAAGQQAADARIEKRKKIDKLTPEQELLANQVAEEWIAIGLSTEPANRPEAERGVRLAFELGGHPPPPPFVCVKCETGYEAAGTCTKDGEPLYAGILWVDSPDAAVKLASKLAGGTPASHLSGFVYGQHAAGWLSFYDAWGRIGVDVHELEGLLTVARHCGWWLPFDCLTICCERPCRLQLDADRRLHDDKEPALAFRDGYALYADHGVVIPARLRTDPASITWQEIDAEPNLEVRRVMLNIYGAGRYIRESGAQKVAEDDYGELYRKDVPGDEPVVMVRVVNATPENVRPGTWHWEGPNGSRVTDDQVLRAIAWAYFLTGHPPDGYTWHAPVPAPDYKEYWIRVPPVVTTAHEAVAWTFGKTPATYDPSIQT
jgi:hypothetical protein